MINTMLTLSEEAREALRTLPRDVSASAIMRWVLIAIVTPEKQLKKKIEASEEAQEVREYLRAHLKKFLD